MTFILLRQIDHPTTGYYSNVFVVLLLGLFIGCGLHAVDGWLHRGGGGAQPRACRRQGWPCGAGYCGSWWPCRSSSFPG